MPPQQGVAQNSAAGAVPQLAGVDLMAILQSVGIQPMQQGPPTDVKQEQQAGMQVRAYCCHRLSSLAGCAMRCAGHVQGAPD